MSYEQNNQDEMIRDSGKPNQINARQKGRSNTSQSLSLNVKFFFFFFFYTFIALIMSYLDRIINDLFYQVSSESIPFSCTHPFLFSLEKCKIVVKKRTELCHPMVHFQPHKVKQDKLLSYWSSISKLDYVRRLVPRMSGIIHVHLEFITISQIELNCLIIMR